MRGRGEGKGGVGKEGGRVDGREVRIETKVWEITTGDRQDLIATKAIKT